MVLCRFYQQGYCRFGNTCRFEHTGNDRQLFTQPPANSNNYYSSNNTYNSRNVGQSNYESSTSVNNRFGALANGADNRAKNYGAQTNTSGSTFTDFVNSVIQELEIGIKGNQWPFSCFGPQKEGDNWPGLEDMSPEELRFEAYNCQREGRPLDAYIRGVELMRNSQTAKNNELKGRSPAVLELMRKLYQGQKLEYSGSFSAPFGQQSSGGASQFQFTLDNQQFGSNLPQQQQPALPASQFNQSASIFGQSSAPKNTWPATQTFGAPSTQSTNAFVAGGSFQAPSSFGHQTETQPQNVFGTSVVQQPQSFGANASVFQAPQAGVAYSPNNSADTTYTPLDVLTDEEKAQFSAPAFTFGKIPIRPPSMEFC